MFAITSNLAKANKGFKKKLHNDWGNEEQATAANFWQLESGEWERT